MPLVYAICNRWECRSHGVSNPKRSPWTSGVQGDLGKVAPTPGFDLGRKKGEERPANSSEMSPGPGFGFKTPIALKVNIASVGRRGGQGVPVASWERVAKRVLKASRRASVAGGSGVEMKGIFAVLLFPHLPGINPLSWELTLESDWIEYFFSRSGNAGTSAVLRKISRVSRPLGLLPRFCNSRFSFQDRFKWILENRKSLSTG